ncbi:MAG: hypothetical protein DRO11_00165 [Methanobacteriota archaeon]|nr:MAG: hypothetical protein DRO11_00165 [Euryarchaeota archaeon]
MKNKYVVAVSIIVAISLLSVYAVITHVENQRYMLRKRYLVVRVSKVDHFGNVEPYDCGNLEIVELPGIRTRYAFYNCIAKIPFRNIDLPLIFEIYKEGEKTGFIVDMRAYVEQLTISGAMGVKERVVDVFILDPPLGENEEWNPHRDIKAVFKVEDKEGNPIDAIAYVFQPYLSDTEKKEIEEQVSFGLLPSTEIIVIENGVGAIDFDRDGFLLYIVPSNEKYANKWVLLKTSYVIKKAEGTQFVYYRECDPKTIVLDQKAQYKKIEQGLIEITIRDPETGEIIEEGNISIPAMIEVWYSDDNLRIFIDFVDKVNLSISASDRWGGG